MILAILAAGKSLRATWLPRLALLSGVGLLIGLAAINPDAWIAEQNIARYEETGKVDWYFLQGLSADAVPTLASLPADVRDCALAGHEEASDDFLEWNHGRSEACPFLDDVDADTAADLVDSGPCVA